MFERFTDRARRVVVWAQEEARSFNHNYIGTEHLLVGLIKEGEGLGGKVLTAVGIDLEMVRGELDVRVGRGASQPKGHIPFTPRAKKVLELSLREAMQYGHNYIGTEHVLLGLLREGQGVAAQILMTRVNGGLDGVKEETLRQMKEFGVRVQPTNDPTPGTQTIVTAAVAEDELVKRLEAIEARLSIIERLLRQQRGESEVS